MDGWMDERNGCWKDGEEWRIGGVELDKMDDGDVRGYRRVRAVRAGRGPGGRAAAWKQAGCWLLGGGRVLGCLVSEIGARLGQGFGAAWLHGCRLRGTRRMWVCGRTGVMSLAACCSSSSPRDLAAGLA